MKRFIPNTLVSIGIFLMMSSCYVASTMQTEVLMPAEFSFPYEVYRVGALSRMDLEKKRTDGQDHPEEVSAFERDSALLKTALYGLLDGLSESPRFEAYEVKPTRVLQGGSSNLSRQLDWSLVEQLAGKDQLDMIISLTTANFQDTTKYFTSTMIYVLYPATYWRVYDLRSQKVYEHVIHDTLNYPAGNSRKGYPSPQDIISNIENALSLQGFNYSKKLAPYWVEEDRVWFPSGNYDLENASALANEGKWLEASEIWRGMAYSSNPRLASRACFNLALASEILNKTDLAIIWLEQASELGLGYYAEYYMETLMNRESLVPFLDEQMNR